MAKMAHPDATLDELPPEILAHILKQLVLQRDRNACSLVCRSLSIAERSTRFELKLRCTWEDLKEVPLCFQAVRTLGLEVPFRCMNESEEEVRKLRSTGRLAKRLSAAFPSLSVVCLPGDVELFEPLILDFGKVWPKVQWVTGLQFAQETKSTALLKAFPELREVHFHKSQPSDLLPACEEVQFYKWRCLERLNCFIDSGCFLNVVPRCTDLIRIDLLSTKGFRIDAEKLSTLFQNCTKLERLGLDGGADERYKPSLSAHAFDSLQCCPNMISIKITEQLSCGKPLSNSLVEGLAGSSHTVLLVKTLCLDCGSTKRCKGEGNLVGGQVMRFTSLTELTLTLCRTDDTMDRVVEGCPSLQKLSLIHSMSRDDFESLVTKLAQAPKLTDLSLEHYYDKLTLKDILEVVDCLKPKLVNVRLHCAQSNNGSGPLAPPMQGWPMLRKLSITCFIGTGDAAFGEDWFVDCPELRILTLGFQACNEIDIDTDFWESVQGDASEAQKERTIPPDKMGSGFAAEAVDEEEGTTCLPGLVEAHGGLHVAPFCRLCFCYGRTRSTFWPTNRPCLKSMSSVTFPSQLNNVTDSEGGEGRHLVQWLRGSLSAERGARKAAQRSVANLENRIASLERQLQAQKSGRSAAGLPSGLQKSSDTETRADLESRVEELSRAKASKGEAQKSKLVGDERLSLEAAAWKAWQTFSGEMAKLAEEREARQAALEHKVQSLAQQVERLLPQAKSQSQESVVESPETSSVEWRASEVPQDYNDVPGTSRTSRAARHTSPLGAAANDGLKADRSIVKEAPSKPENVTENDRQDAREKHEEATESVVEKEQEADPIAEPNVGSLAIWGDLASQPGPAGRPSGHPVEATGGNLSSQSASAGRPSGPPVETTGSFSLGGSRLRHMQRSTDEDDLDTWTKESDTCHQQTSGGVSTQPEEPGTCPLPGALYTPLEDDSVWDSIFSGAPQNLTDEAMQEFDGPGVLHTIANLRGQLDSRFLGAVAFEEFPEEELPPVQPWPSPMPYVTLPNTPLHEAAGLHTQLSRSDSGASSDFR